jgi:hypothetical protein
MDLGQILGGLIFAILAVAFLVSCMFIPIGQRRDDGSRVRGWPWNDEEKP